MQSILIVEDEKRVADLLKAGLCINILTYQSILIHAK